MSVSDPIADYLTIIRNGSKAGFNYVDVPASKIKRQITRVLYAQGFIKRFIYIDDQLQGLLRIHQYTVMCAPTTSQMAALTALQIGTPFVREMQAEYNRRRKLIVDSDH